MRLNFRISLVYILIIISFVLIGLNLIVDIRYCDIIGIITNCLLIIIVIVLNYRYKLIDNIIGNHANINEETNRDTEGIKEHLSEQRHDFLNVLQVVSGYVQLGKKDRVLDYILSYSRKTENIGRLYNMKNIKFADTLCSIGKESNDIEVDFDISIEVYNNNHIDILEKEDMQMLVSQVIYNYFFAIKQNEDPKLRLNFRLYASENDIIMDICIKGDTNSFKDFQFLKEEIFWEPIQKQIYPLDLIKKQFSKAKLYMSISKDCKKTKILVKEVN